MKNNSMASSMGDAAKKKAIIEAIKNRDIDKLKLLVGKKVMLSSFLDLLKFTSNPDNNYDDAILSEDLENLMGKIGTPT